jgi:hypothetical protein
MFKKILLCSTILTILSQNPLFPCQNPSKKPLPIPLKAAIKSGKAGFKSGFLLALPAIYFLNGYPLDKILVPFISGLSAGAVSFTTGGIYAWLRNNPAKQGKLLCTAKGMGLSFGITAGACAIIMAQMSEMRIGRY